MNSSSGSSGDLHAEVTRAGMIHRPDVGDGVYQHQGLIGDLLRFSNDAADHARQKWVTALHAFHLTAEGAAIAQKLRDEGHEGVLRGELIGNIPASEIKGAHHLGPGAVTNVGTFAMANDPFWPAPSAASAATFALANYHATGTGTTAASASDIQLQTADAVTPVAGTQSLVITANAPGYKTVATLAYTGTEAVTEWGLHTAGTLSATTGSPLTAVSATSATVTGTPLTASSTTVRGQTQYIIKAGTTASYGLVTANTTSVLTIPAWFKTADGTAGTTPGSTEAFTLRPVMLDHKVFAAINVVNGDSIQFSYTVSPASGG